MSWSIGANAPTRAEVKARLAEANANTGGMMPSEIAAVVDSAIDLIPEVPTITVSVSGNLDEDPEKPSRITVLVSSKA